MFVVYFVLFLIETVGYFLNYYKLMVVWNDAFCGVSWNDAQNVRCESQLHLLIVNSLSSY
jgi:uncharacterized membrane protein (UPF0182 family)